MTPLLKRVKHCLVPVDGNRVIHDQNRRIIIFLLLWPRSSLPSCLLWRSVEWNGFPFLLVLRKAAATMLLIPPPPLKKHKNMVLKHIKTFFEAERGLQ